MTKKHYLPEGIELVECYICHRDTLITKAGKFRNNGYCDEHYLKRLEDGINEWKIAYKHWRNGKKGMLSQTEIMEAPSLSQYIN